MEPGTFRITDTAAKIDMSSNEGWLVFDHNTGSDSMANYYNPTLGMLTTSPTSSTALTSSQARFKSHIYNFTNEGKTNMVFGGYPDIAGFDAMIYPAPSNARRTFSFDVNGKAVLTHTLSSTGFMMNVGKNANGTLSGYYLRLTGGNNAINNAAIWKVDNYNPTANQPIAGAVVGSATQATTLGPVNKARFTVELRETSVTVQKQNYDAAGNLGAIETLFGGTVALQPTGYNGFGPFMSSTSHGCSDFTQFSFLDLEMRYDSSAFDALKTVQYYEGAQQKYFINLAGDSNNPQIPDEMDETYKDGINRMNENEIFYLSNAQDGQVIRDTTTDADGTHLGLGSDNGYIAMGEDFVSEMASYIAKAFEEGKKFNQAPIASPLPLANFYMIDPTTGEQVMTIHQQHLVNSGATVHVNFFDKSKPGALAGEDGKIAQWRFRVYDPDNMSKYDSGWKTDPKEIQDYIFDANSKHGKWLFELTVKDQLGNESKSSQTYITAFKDDKEPIIEGSNSGRNEVTITLTDTGQGIDDDGITFIEDNRGSGVAAYWVTDNTTAQPTDDDWIPTPEVTHQYSFVHPLVDTDPIVVWVKDECGNIGSVAVFQPTRVIVQDPDGNPIDDYLVVDDKPIIVLPDEDTLGKPDDEDEKFSGWVDPDGKPYTPGTDVPKNDDHTIIIRPSYAKGSSNLIYLANGGTIPTNDNKAYAQFQVVAGNSIITKIDDQNVAPVREGYSFQGWKLISAGASDTNATIDALVNKEAGTTTAAANRLVSPDDQSAKLVLNDPDGNPTDPANIKMNNYYLVAQWKIGDYTVRLDANGGSLGATRSFEGVQYATNVKTLALPTSGRTVPTKPGYIFKGWSTTKNAMDKYENALKVASGVTGITELPQYAMPSHDITLYAMWQYDTNKFIVSFDSDGGSKITDVAYQKSNAPSYATSSMKQFPTPSKPGYDFTGWHLVNEDGSIADAVTDGTGAPLTTENHTFKATWTPRNDTKYTVDYFINSGNKNADGQYIYTKVNTAGVTKTYTATTESSVSVSAADKVSELTVGSANYWYNEANASNVLSGTVTGSPTLSLRLYYDRYFDVVATKGGKGSGSVTGATKQKEGTNPTVSWKANAGSKVSKVVIDGIVRDDLLNKNSYTFELADGMHENHRIYVEFASGSGNVAKPEDQYYKIRTLVTGCTDQNAYEITPTTSVKGTSNHTVTWTIKDPKYVVESVTVDGVEQEDTGSVSFTGVLADHEVVVKLKTLPTIGGTTEANKYTVTVNRYGGTDGLLKGKTQILNSGEKAVVSWDCTDTNYRVYKVMIDGVEYEGLTATNLLKMDFSRAPLSKVTANHVVDVYFAELDPETSEPIAPDFTDEDQFVKVTTQLVGASGTITGGAVIKNGDDYNVAWTVNGLGASKNEENVVAESVDPVTGEKKYLLQVGDPNTDDYVCYEVEKVTVNDMVIDNADNRPIQEIDLATITKDTDVKVHVKPLLHQVTILKYGQGTVSPSKFKYHLSNYRDIQAVPASSWSLVRIVDDGVEQYKYVAPETEGGEAAASLADEVVETPEAAVVETPADEVVAPETEDAPEVTEEAPEATDAEAVVDEPVADEAQDAVEAETEAEAAEVAEDEVVEDAIVPMLGEEVQADEVVPMVDNSAAYDLMGFDFPLVNAPVSPAAYHNAVASRTVADVVTHEDPVADPTKIKDREGIIQDHLIEVYFTQNDPVTGDPVPAPDPSTLHTVNVKINGGLGGTVTGGAKVETGESDTISWTIADPGNYFVSSVTVNGEPVEFDPTTNTITLDGIDGDRDVVINVEPIERENSLEDPIDPSFKVEKHMVTAVITGSNKGTISGAGEVTTGSDRTVSWTHPDNEEVKYVFVNGENRPDLVKAGKVDLTNITADQKVVVAVAEKGKQPTNVDKDDDGKPDINIDKDGDGEPDVNVDTDGDGEPDINVDKDGDGEPDINIDTDGDGKPDINIDKDGDGEPDVNVDKDGDGKPDINIDTDGDGVPDVNIDTDGDGEPDINIDKDGDGKPDVNIDNDGDGKPDVNIDTDGDGEPDVNVDTDGDGTPDVNIDTDGDNVPDIQIDVDKDGIPDINIDTNKDGVPDINVDVDGDGKPDVNIDTDNTGEWKPSSEGGNADGIWKPDTNIDIGDGKGSIYTDYSTPIDLDGDGVDDRWKPSFMVSTSGKPYGTMQSDWVDNGRGDTPADQVPGAALPNTGGAANGDDEKTLLGLPHLLAQTGDTTSTFALIMLGMILAAGATAVVARRREQH